MITRATSFRGRLNPVEARKFAKRLTSIEETLRSMVAKGHGLAVGRVCEIGIAALDVTLDYRIRDNDGMVMEGLRRLMELHLDACTAAPPTTHELAQRLFDLGSRSRRQLFTDAAEVYAELLGGTGLAEYRHLLDEALTQISSGRLALDRSAKGLRLMRESLERATENMA